MTSDKWYNLIIFYHQKYKQDFQGTSLPVNKDRNKVAGRWLEDVILMNSSSILLSD